jgi:predicted aspartyl protease
MLELSTFGANILADADWDMDFGDDVYYTIDTGFAGYRCE